MGLGYTFRDGDWPRLRQIIQKLSSLNIGPDATPTFAGLTLTGNLVIPDDGYIGSESDTDAIQIEADGDVVMSQDLSITGSVTAANYTAANLLTACATNAGALDFSSAGLTITVAGSATVNAGTHLDHALTLDANLVAWWRMDDISGSVVTDYAGSNDGTLVGGPSQAAGVLGKAISLNGATQWMTASGSALNSNFAAFAFSAWIRPGFSQESAANYRIFDKGDDGDTAVIRALYSADINDWRFQTTTSSGQVNCETAGLTWDADTWHFILMTYDGTNMRIYWDGEIAQTEGQTGAIQNGTGDFILGTNVLGAISFLGDFDDVKFWDRNISSDEAKELYELGALDAMTAFSAAYFKEYVASRSGFFNHIYVGEGISTGFLEVTGGLDIDINASDLIGAGNILPEDDGEQDLGSATKSWDFLYIDDIIMSESGQIVGPRAIISLRFDEANLQFEFMNGNVGIRTTTPDETLQVVGSVKFGDDNTNFNLFSATGVQTMAGGARVWRKESMEAAGFKAPGLKPAELTETGLGFAWAFADDDDEIVLAHYMLPPDADTSVQPKIMLHWGCADNTGNAYWQIEYLWMAENQDLTNATPDGTVNATDAVSGTVNGYTQTTAQLAHLAAGDTMLHVRIKRLGTQGADTLTGDTFLHCACLLYVSNKLGTAT